MVHEHRSRHPLLLRWATGLQFLAPRGALKSDLQPFKIIQKKASTANAGQGEDQGLDPEDDLESEINSPDFQRNPLVDNGEVYARDQGGKFCK
ncbi:hypothetical protein ACHAP7_010017 [Fusarium lateritium]